MNVIRKPFRYTFYNATLILAGLNMLMFLLQQLYPQVRVYLTLNPVLMVKAHWFWQCVTYMFVHSNLEHLFVNMLSLIMFGRAVERSLGSKEFILLYMVTGILSGLISLGLYCLTGAWNVWLVGASGAIYGLLLAFAVIFPSSRIFVFFVLPVPAPLLIVVYAAYELYSGVFSAGGNVAHATHLAGMVVAWIYFRIRLGVNPITVWSRGHIR